MPGKSHLSDADAPYKGKQMLLSHEVALDGGVDLHAGGPWWDVSVMLFT